MNTISNFLTIKPISQPIKLVQQLDLLEQEQFTGRLEIRFSEKLQWRLYFCLGRIVWADGGEQSDRSWKRHLAKYCPQLNYSQSQRKNLIEPESVKYQILISSLEEKLIKLQQFKALVQSRVEEFLFDILQQEASQKLDYHTQEASTCASLALVLTMPPVLLKASDVLEKSQLSWLEWVQRDLRFCSPNMSLYLAKPQEMAQLVSTSTYKNLVKLLNGKNSLRDIAFFLEQDVENLASSLISFVRQGLIESSAPEEALFPTNSSQRSIAPRSLPSLAKKNNPLIVAIDDDSRACELMAQILEEAGYEFLGINEGLQAISTLISCQPDLIFLNKKMPIMNGYEIASQIQRVPHLKKIPVVMLIDSWDVFSWLRAKTVRVTSLVTKPMNELKLLMNVDRFLSKTGSQLSLAKSDLSPEMSNAKKTVKAYRGIPDAHNA